MYDINFFSVYKKRKSKNNGFKTFAIIFLLVYVLANALMIGAYVLYTSGVQANINEMEAYINSEETKTKIIEAARIKQEATLTKEYLTLLQSSSDKLSQIKFLNTALLDKVRSLTPATTFFTSALYNGNILNLSCQSSLITDPMDMYHAFLNDPTFANVTLSSISIDAVGSTFSITCQITGGEDK